MNQPGDEVQNKKSVDAAKNLGVQRVETKPSSELDAAEGWLLFAVETGDGWCLEVADPQGVVIAHLAWPKWWPEKVTARHLRKSGFDVIPA